MTDTRPRHTVRGIRVLFLGRFVALILLLVGMVNFALTQSLGLGFDSNNIWYGLAGYIGSFIVMCGFFFLYGVNGHFKRALVLHIPLTFGRLATFLHEHSVIVLTTNDFITNYLFRVIFYLVSFAVAFSLCWGMARIARESGLPHLGRRFKLLILISILIALPTLIMREAAAFVLLRVGAPLNIAAIVVSLVWFLPLILLGLYELYLLYFTYTQLGSETPKDTKDVFRGRRIKILGTEISTLTKPKPRKTIARFFPGGTHRRWRVRVKR